MMGHASGMCCEAEILFSGWWRNVDRSLISKLSLEHLLVLVSK